MFVVDTNILIYAASRRFPEHPRARQALRDWRSGPVPCLVTWGILYEFMHVTTHRKVFRQPWAWAEACRFVQELLDGPSVGVLRETARHAEVAAAVARECSAVSGNLIHDAHTAILMREHGVTEIRTADAHFSRFPFLRVVNPLD